MRFNRTRRLTAAMVLAGFALVAAAAGASAASPSAADKAADALPFSINGPWTDNGSAKPIVTAVGNAIVIDMSYAHRPSATGAVIDASSILVTFPDAGTLIGTFLAPTYLQWSNGSVWHKVYAGPTVIDLNDNWVERTTTQHVTQSNGYIGLDMSATHRPKATGFMVSASKFVVSFPDDPGTTFATLHAAADSSDIDSITWSNGTQWFRASQPPGPPGCLQAQIVLC